MQSRQATETGTSRILPFLKWPGGKRWLLSQHPEWFAPPSTVRHIEPFLGGAAAFFYARPSSAVLTDFNPDLIATYEAIQKQHAEVLVHLRKHHREHSIAHYYHVRRQSPRTPATKAARFIYLNRTCFNGIYRVNLKGEFNVPIGTKTNVVLPTDDFKRISELLGSAILDQKDFEETVNIACETDFLYVDPPYTVQHNNNNFVKYNESIFSWADQIRLAMSVRNAARRGVHVLVSNADHPSIRELYKDLVWRQVQVHRVSKLASASKFRLATTELVISNYIAEDGTVGSVRI